MELTTAPWIVSMMRVFGAFFVFVPSGGCSDGWKTNLLRIGTTGQRVGQMQMGKGLNGGI